MALAFLALSIWVWSALAKTSAFAPWPSCVASWLEAPKLNVSLAFGLACWNAVAMSWKTSVSEEAAKKKISREPVAAGFAGAVGAAAGAALGAAAGELAGFGAAAVDGEGAVAGAAGG